MLKNLGLKNSLISSLFGLSMLTTLVACGEKVSSNEAFNKMVNSDYSVVQLKSTQFEILSEYTTKVKYKNETNCKLEDDTNGIYVYAAEESSLSLNSKSEDDYIIASINTFFLDDGLNISSNATSKTYKFDDFTKILFNDLTVETKDGKSYMGKLSILDYGMNETFVLAYTDKKENLDMDYITKSLKAIDNSKNMIVVSEIPKEKIEEIDMTYTRYMENNQVVVEDIPIIDEQKDEINPIEILSNTKVFNGNFFKFSGYYGLDRIVSQNENSLNYGSSYLHKNNKFVLGLDIINLNQVNEVYGDVHTNDEKIAYITNYYKESANIDLAAIYSNNEILDCYNISVSNGILEEYLSQYGLNDDYNYCKKEMFGKNEWIIVSDFSSKVTLSGYENCNVTFAFTIDDTSNAYMICFVYTPELKDVVSKTLSTFEFSNVGDIIISNNQMNMYGEFLDVE